MITVTHPATDFSPTHHIFVALKRLLCPSLFDPNAKERESVVHVVRRVGTVLFAKQET